MTDACRPLRFLSFVALSMLVACGGDDGTTPEPDPTISVSVSPGSLSVEQGQDGSVTVSVVRGGGFDGTVTVTATGVPSGVTAGAVTVAAGATSADVTFSAAADAAVGTVTVTLTGTGAGVDPATATLGLEVTEAPTGGFQLAMDPSSVTVDAVPSAGGEAVSAVPTASSTVVITREAPFDGAVELSVSDAPADLATTLSETSVTGDQATLMVEALAGLAPGMHTVTVTGTGDGVDDGTTTLQVTVSPLGGFTLSLDPASVEVEQGASVQSTVGIAREAPFDGAVTLALSGAPAGLTATLAETSVAGDQTTLTVEADAGIAPGTYAITITGTGDAVTGGSVELEVVVTEAPAGGFTLALDPASVSVQQGASAESTVGITREAPFEGAVTLALSGAPAGLTATLAETPVAGDQTTLTVEADAGLAPGMYTVTVTGTADGVPDRSVELSVTVSEAGGGMFTVAVCDADWLAVKDGDDPWERVTGSGDQYSFDASSSRIGIAWVQVLPGQFGLGEQITTEVYYLDASQVPFFQDPCERVEDGKTITGTVAGLDGADFGTVQLGFVAATVASAMPAFTLENVPDGPLDLIATRGVGSDDTFQSDRMIIRRDQALPDGTSLTLDFDASEAFALDDASVTLAGLVAGDYIFSSSFQTSGSFYLGSLATRLNPTSPVTVPAVPAGERETGDLHALLLGQESRSVLQYEADPAGATVTLGPALAPVTVTSTTTADGVFPAAAFTPQTEYSELWTVDFSQSDFTGGIDVTVSATAAWVNGGGPELAVPDFSGVDGWNTTWNLVTGTEISWSASAADGFLEFAFPADGTVLGFGNASGTINP